MKTEIIQAIPDWMFVALKKWGWKGAFDSWEAAQLCSNGYNADNNITESFGRLIESKGGRRSF